MACKSVIALPSISAGRTGKHMRYVSCGRCNPCRVAKRNAWLFRLSKEAERWPYVYFITLTYEDSFLPKGIPYVDEDTGEIFDLGTHPSLRKSDLQKFWKRLRFNTDAKLRYYAVGEYGSKTRRPHYHAIVFTDLDFKPRFSHFTRNRVPLFRSFALEQSWSFGFASISEVTDARIAYTLKYITKVAKSIPDTEPQFSVSSQRLGSNVFTPEMVSYWFSHPSNFKLTYHGFTIPMCKYFKDILLRDAHDYRSLVSDYLNEIVPEIKEAKLREFAKGREGMSPDRLLDAFDSTHLYSSDFAFDTSVL